MDNGEFRFDPLTRRWVNIVAHRQGRPNLDNGGCPFCVGGIEAPEPYEVSHFTNRWSSFSPGDAVAFTNVEPENPRDATSVVATGAAEVILYSPDHAASLATLSHAQVRLVVDLWAERTAALLRRPEIEYVLVFENRGAEVGATVDHPHGQIYGFPFMPPEPAREATINLAHGCASCAELALESEGERLVHSSDSWLGYLPFASAYPYGVRLTSARHVGRLVDLDDVERDGLATALIDLLSRYDNLWTDSPLASARFPYLMWIHQASKSDTGEQHLHIHLAPPHRSPGIPRYVASGELGSGTFSNPVAPERAAADLRAAES